MWVRLTCCKSLWHFGTLALKCVDLYRGRGCSIGGNAPRDFTPRAVKRASAYFSVGSSSCRHPFKSSIILYQRFITPTYKGRVRVNEIEFSLSFILSPAGKIALIPSNMAAPVQITKASELHTNTGQTEGMIRQGAIVDKSDNISASVMIAHPHSSSAVHHHGPQDTVVYCVRGRGAVVSEGGKKRQVLEKGDFALIPAHAEHQEVNDGDEEVEWIITRSGRVPVVENLEGWGKN